MLTRVKGASFDLGDNYLASVTIADQDATPSVVGAYLLTTANTVATTITQFDGGLDGQFIVVVVNDIYTTFDCTGTILKGNHGADYTADIGDMVFASYDGTNWQCIFHRASAAETAQALSGPGAVNLSQRQTHITTTGADAFTLADGYEGQEKFIVLVVDGGDATLTPTNLGNGTTVTFDDAGDCALLRFSNTDWYFIGGTATLA